MIFGDVRDTLNSTAKIIATSEMPLASEKISLEKGSVPCHPTPSPRDEETL